MGEELMKPQSLLTLDKSKSGKVKNYDIRWIRCSCLFLDIRLTDGQPMVGICRQSW